MTRLANFTPQEQDLLLQIPYAVGLWMSSSDDDEGNVDDSREAAQLRKVVAQLTRQDHEDELVADVFASLHDVLEQGDWQTGTENLMDRVRAALRVIGGVASEREAKAYAQALILVATSVAQAYGEQAGYDADLSGDEKGWMDRVRRVAKFARDRALAVADRQRNISPAEDSALTELHDVLRDALRKPL